MIHRGSLRGAALVALLLLGAALPARADDKKAPPAAAATTPPAAKVKTYNFTGLDVEGRLRGPQLLYFLSRMRAELDATTPVRRSFIPELNQTGDDL